MGIGVVSPCAVVAGFVGLCMPVDGRRRLHLRVHVETVEIKIPSGALHEAPRLMLSHPSGAWLEAGQIRHSAPSVLLAAGESLANAVRLAEL